jgi:hypothetical protein
MRRPVIARLTGGRASLRGFQTCDPQSPQFQDFAIGHCLRAAGDMIISTSNDRKPWQQVLELDIAPGVVPMQGKGDQLKVKLPDVWARVLT